MFSTRDVSARLAQLAALLGLAGCDVEVAAPRAAAHPTDTAPRAGGTLRYASLGDIRSLDPARANDAVATSIIRLLFASLVEFDEQGHLAPELAERWDILDGGKHFRFFLRQDVQFHDGSRFTADDMKRSLERALAPDTPNPSASYFRNIIGYDSYVARKVPHLDGVEVDGSHILSIRLSAPDAAFLPLLTLPSARPVCPSAGSRFATDWHPCGAGPFQLRQGGWSKGRFVRVVRSDSYFVKALPYLDAIELHFLVNPSTQRFKFEAGELDFVRDLGHADTLRFARDRRWQPLITRGPDVDIYGESMNTEMPPFDNVEVRRAVAAAIDRKALVALRPLHLSVHTSAIPRSTPGFDPTFEGQTFDLARALEHMRRAGYPFDPKTGQGGYPHTLPYLVYPQGLFEKSGQLIQQQLARIGLRLELRLVSWASYLALTQRRRSVAIAPMGWQQDYPDPSGLLDPLFGSASINDTESSNSAFYRNPAFDALLARARGELDPQRRASTFRECNTILRDDAPWAFTVSHHAFEVHQPYLRGYAPHPVYHFNFARTWLDRATATRSALEPAR
jgi:ABC-type transport system substrate-binding protein